MTRDAIAKEIQDGSIIVTRVARRSAVEGKNKMTSRSLAPIYNTASTGPFSTFLLGLVVLSNTCCTVNTGTRISLSRSDVERINTIGISTRRDKGFSVLLHRTEVPHTGSVTGTVIGGAVGGLIGRAVEEAGQASRDARLERVLETTLASFVPEQSIQQTLCKLLQEEKIFGAAVPVLVENGRTALSQRGIDAILQVTIKEWGLRLCPPSRSEDELLAAFEIEIKMFMLYTDRPVWHRNEIYLDGRCYSFDAFRSQPELLTQVLTEAIEELCRRIIYEMVYS